MVSGTSFVLKEISRSSVKQESVIQAITVRELVPLWLALTWDSGLLVTWSSKKFKMAADSQGFTPLILWMNNLEKNKLFSPVTGCVLTNGCSVK